MGRTLQVGGWLAGVGVDPASCCMYAALLRTVLSAACLAALLSFHASLYDTHHPQLPHQLPLLLPTPPCRCRSMVEGAYSGMLEASGGDACEWLLSDGFELRLFTFFPCTDITPSAANGSATPDSMQSMAAMLEDPDCMKEVGGLEGLLGCGAWAAAAICVERGSQASGIGYWPGLRVPGVELDTVPAALLT